MTKKILYSILAMIAFGMFACEDYTENYNVPLASTVAKFSYEAPNGLEPPTTITFTNESIIPEHAGTPSYSWDFGDGNTSAEENPTHEFTEEGDFTVTFTVTTANTGEVKTASELLNLDIPLKGDTLLFEDFESINLIPETWVLANLDGAVPATEGDANLADSAWVVAYSSRMESKVALGVSYYNPETGADDWMILPKITLGENSLLAWDAMSFTSSGNYPDSYQIYVSTTTQDVAGCQENGIIYRVIDEAWSEDITDPQGKGKQHRELSLKRFAGQDVHIAFRLMTPDPGGSSLGIDNIVVIDQ